MKQIRLAQKRQKYAFRIQILDKLNRIIKLAYYSSWQHLIKVRSKNK